MEVSGGNYYFLAHSLHFLPRITLYIPGRLRHRYRLCRGQTAPEVSGHEGGGLVRDISVTAQGGRCLRKGHIPRNSGGIWSRASSLPHQPDIQ